MVSERDEHKMPPLFVGKMTPELVKEKEKAHKHAEELREKMNKIYADKKIKSVV